MKVKIGLYKVPSTVEIFIHITRAENWLRHAKRQPKGFYNQRQLYGPKVHDYNGVVQ